MTNEPRLRIPKLAVESATLVYILDDDSRHEVPLMTANVDQIRALKPREWFIVARELHNE